MLPHAIGVTIHLPAGFADNALIVRRFLAPLEQGRKRDACGSPVATIWVPDSLFPTSVSSNDSMSTCIPEFSPLEFVNK